MSVYEVNTGITDIDQSNPVTIVDPVLVMEDAKLPGNSEPIRPGALPSESAHRHNDSTSTQQTAESADSSPTTTMANRTTFDIEPFHEDLNNEDQKSPGYPDGPIAIYGDNVFLYLEPTAEEASRFDVVINVAREVSNPFKVFASPEIEERPAEDSPIPETAATTASFATAYEYFPESADTTPTTPKAQPLKEPEYIHIPWDHNTDISQDLKKLCETIDTRTKEGKKVLVHCQQGASRSASLIIAYGLYQKPELSVNDAYYAAQAKSRWISPNMRLMYCLQDFQKENAKRRPSPIAGLKPRLGRGSPTKHRMTMSADNIDVPTKEPLTAPLPGDSATSNGPSPARSPKRARADSTPNRGEPISPGPSSAPSSFSWSEKEDESDPGKFGRFNLDSAASVSWIRTPDTIEVAPITWLCAVDAVEVASFAWFCPSDTVEVPSIAWICTIDAVKFSPVTWVRASETVEAAAVAQVCSATTIKTATVSRACSARPLAATDVFRIPVGSLLETASFSRIRRT
ncbi:tyrosine/serine/threonine protein phosphatase [Collariella sp. IMI 366227]|nr:tyrosine/serine/threonine protein phosphatase [Collariella sp. IMI 366227]